ncbi:MAG: hypothetical protein ACQEWV_31630 [Bacillota bacterium]
MLVVVMVEHRTKGNGMRFPEWYPIALIAVSTFSALWAIIQICFHFQKRKWELRKLKAETMKSELEAERAKIEVINAGTNLRRGLYDIERSKMSLLESQNKLAEKWGIPAGAIRWPSTSVRATRGKVNLFY